MPQPVLPGRIILNIRTLNEGPGHMNMLKTFCDLPKDIQARLISNISLRRISTESLIPFMTIFCADVAGAAIAGYSTIVILGISVYSNLYGEIVSEKLPTKTILKIGELAHIASIILIILSMKLGYFYVIGAYALKSIAFWVMITAGYEKLILENSDKQSRTATYQINQSAQQCFHTNWGAYWCLSYGYGIETLLWFSLFTSVVVYLVYIMLFSSTDMRSHDLL